MEIGDQLRVAIAISSSLLKDVLSWFQNSLNHRTFNWQDQISYQKTKHPSLLK